MKSESRSDNDNSNSQTLLKLIAVCEDDRWKQQAQVDNNFAQFRQNVILQLQDHFHLEFFGSNRIQN